MNYFSVVIAYCAAVLAAILCFGVLFQGKRAIPHWSFAVGMLVLAVESCFQAFSSEALWWLSLPPTAVGNGSLQALVSESLLKQQAVFWQTWRVAAMALLPAPWLLFTFTYARGNAAEFLPRWQYALLLAFVVPPALALTFRGQLIDTPAQVAPGAPWSFVLREATMAGVSFRPGKILNLTLLLATLLCLMNLERTFRASVGTMRWRIKFMILGLGMLFAVRAYGFSQSLLYPSVSQSVEVLNSAALCVACVLVLRSLLRTGHFEVNVYPSHSLIHHSLTILLAGIYLVLVGILAKIVPPSALQPLLILLLLVLLGLVLLSDRVRLYTKRFVSRHFQRPLYDYRTVWRTFTEATARRVEQGEFCSAVVKLVSDIFQALSVSIWLVDEKKDKLVFVTSTSLSQSKAGQLALDPADAVAVIRALSEHPEPVDIDASKEFWAAPLRRSHPEDFHKGGNRVCVPLMAGGELLGVLMLGDRVSGFQFSTQDIDLLKSVGDQAAASLLNIQLSQRLSQAKQLEAFQAMSAFFVHDLKNTASTLSLMLRNFPAHYQDAQFREDALRGISKTVEHVNDLINRLNFLRHELALQPIDCDLNELVADTLKGQDQTPGIELVKDLTPIPKVRVDPSQIQKVVTNLVLNARDAVGTAGRIRIQTSRRNGWVVLAVCDNGCGMTPDFVRTKLFRPFQTTKNKGIGIGMFHCKMIVEAHKGRIEVESEPGKGTSFHVLLPVAP